MGCGCKKNRQVINVSVNNKSVDIPEDSYQVTHSIDPAFGTQLEFDFMQDYALMSKIQSTKSIQEALDINLEQCYLCAKKHIVRAQIFFEEYHTGYRKHAYNLIESLRVSEDEVKKAFLLWQKVMGHLDMAAGELLGKDVNSETMKEDHIHVANLIRFERLKFSDDLQYVPDFDTLLLSVHKLQYS